MQLWFAGNIPYAAPEVVLGKPCTVMADVFSFGVIAWEVVTHEAPSSGDLQTIKIPEEAPGEVETPGPYTIHVCLEFSTAESRCPGLMVFESW